MIAWRANTVKILKSAYESKPVLLVGGWQKSPANTGISTSNELSC